MIRGDNVKKILFLFIIISMITASSCSTNSSKEICKYWKGYLSNPEGKKITVTINFIGSEINEGGSRVLKADKLIISGDGFTKNIEFKSPNGSKSLKSWVFATQSQDPDYPYGIVSVSSDYKDITGQIPEFNEMSTFYSIDDNASILKKVGYFASKVLSFAKCPTINKAGHFASQCVPHLNVSNN